MSAKATTLTFAKEVTLASELTLHLEEVLNVHHHVVFIVLFNRRPLPTHCRIYKWGFEFGVLGLGDRVHV